MIKFDDSFEEAQRMAALEDARGSIGDPHSIGSYAQALKHADGETTVAGASVVLAHRVRRTLASRSRHNIRFLAQANAEIRA